MTEQTMTYTVEVHHENGAYWAEVKELPGCFASGFTLDELYASVEESMSLYLSEAGRQVQVRLAGVERTSEPGVVEERRKFELCYA